MKWGPWEVGEWRVVEVGCRRSGRNKDREVGCKRSGRNEGIGSGV